MKNERLANPRPKTNNLAMPDEIIQRFQGDTGREGSIGFRNIWPARAGQGRQGRGGRGGSGM
ncbi:hypothetical protein [Martelella sp.]|uniref:hypothetical protein n=1 Tax=Martelella sp. TaxID=1969699 RepID=UPI003242C399